MSEAGEIERLVAEDEQEMAKRNVDRLDKGRSGGGGQGR